VSEYDESLLTLSSNTMDRWIMSFTQSLLSFFHTEMEAYPCTVVPKLVKFVDNLTNWYVRMNRNRLKVIQFLEKPLLQLNSFLNISSVPYNVETHGLFSTKIIQLTNKILLDFSRARRVWATMSRRFAVGVQRSILSRSYDGSVYAVFGQNHVPNVEMLLVQRRCKGGRRSERALSLAAKTKVLLAQIHYFLSEQVFIVIVVLLDDDNPLI
jgi:hypothetical protein